MILYFTCTHGYQICISFFICGTFNRCYNKKLISKNTKNVNVNHNKIELDLSQISNMYVILVARYLSLSSRSKDRHLCEKVSPISKLKAEVLEGYYKPALLQQCLHCPIIALSLSNHYNFFNVSTILKKPKVLIGTIMR